MKDYPCKFGEGCKKKDFGCAYVHPSEPNYQQCVQQKESRDSRHGGPSSGPRRFANATASNTTSLPEGVNRWGRNVSNTGGVRNPSASENDASSAWNFSGQSKKNGHSSNATLTDTTPSFGNSAWGSTDNNAETYSGTGWATGSADSTRTNGNATVGWGAGNAADGGWGTGNSGQGDGGWGAPIPGKDDGGWGAAVPGKDNGGWGTTNSGGQRDGGGWGAALPGGHKDDGGWGTTNSGGHRDGGGWGTGNSGGDNDGGGWGSNNANIAKSKDDGTNKGWDQSNFGSRGGLEAKSTDAQKDKGKGKMSEDIQMRDPSPTRQQDEPQPKSAQPIPRSPSKLVAESPAQIPLSPKYMSLPSAVSTSPDLKSLALEVAKLKTPPMKVKGTEARRALYQSIIKHTKNAIIAYMEHREAQTDLNRWKDTQMSTIYGHATQKTRKILDSERATFHRRLQDGEDAFQKEINALVTLPEWSTTNKKRKPDSLTKEHVAQYTLELQDWFKDLKIHKRLLTEGEPEEGEIAEEKEEGEVNDSDEEDMGQRVSELLQSGKLTWKVLTEVIEVLQSRYDTLQTKIYFDIFTSIDDESKTEVEMATAGLELIEHEEIQDDELAAVSTKIATTGKNLERQSEELARLLSEAAELKKKIEAVRVQATQASSVCQLADRLFGDFEQWKEDDNAQLTAITEQVKHLDLCQPSASSMSRNPSVSVVTAAAPPHPSTSSQSAPESISPSDLIDPIRRLVIDAIHKELDMCFDNLRFRCMENQQRLETEMEEEAKRIMSKAEIVKSKLAPSTIPSQSNIPLVAHSFAPH